LFVLIFVSYSVDACKFPMSLCCGAWFFEMDVSIPYLLGLSFMLYAFIPVIKGVDVMANAFVFYDSKYGNTKLCAEKIAEGLRGEGVAVDVGHVKEVSADHSIDYNAIVLAAPNHMGRPSQTMKKFVNQLSIQGLKDKKLAIVGTYSGKARTMDRAVRKMEKMAQKKLAGLALVLPSLSVQVNGLSGPVVDGELPKCVAFGKNLATEL
jgi:menaquinone-dependent protoporphyrinogen IX oxidase